MPCLLAIHFNSPCRPVRCCTPAATKGGRTTNNYDDQVKDYCNQVKDCGNQVKDLGKDQMDEKYEMTGETIQSEAFAV
jgi:hypothetical protein